MIKKKGDFTWALCAVMGMHVAGLALTCFELLVSMPFLGYWPSKLISGCVMMLLVWKFAPTSDDSIRAFLEAGDHENGTSDDSIRTFLEASYHENGTKLLR